MQPEKSQCHADYFGTSNPNAGKSTITSSQRRETEPQVVFELGSTEFCGEKGVLLPTQALCVNS